MVYVRWWHSFFISVTLVTWALSQPLFGYVISNGALERTGAKDILVLMAVYQWLPVALVFTIDRAVCRIEASGGVALRVWRSSIFGLAALPFLRILQLGGHFPFASGSNDWPLGLRLLGVGILIVALLVLAYRYHRPATLSFLYLFAVSLVLTGVFIAQVGLLGRGWVYDPGGSALPEPAAISGLTPIFLIVFDALGGQVLLQDGEIDRERFPNLAALGSESAVFTNATANYMDTHSSITALLNGRFVSNHPIGAEANSDPASSILLETLSEAGYLVEFHSSYFACRQEHLVCLDRAIWSAKDAHVAARNFAIWFLPKNVARAIRGLVLSVFPREVTLQLPIETIHREDLNLWNSFLARVTIVPAEGRAYFVHSLLSHRPYEFDRNGVRVSTLSPGRLEGDFEAMGKAYEEQVMFLDTLIGDFVSILKQGGLYKRSFIIITGDHGPRSLGLRHSSSGFDQATDYPTELDSMIPWVPLIIHGPGISPQTYSVDYQHVDLLPTVLEVLAMPTPAGLDGVSGFSSSRPQREKVFHVYPLKADGQEKVTYWNDASSGRWRRNK